MRDSRARARGAIVLAIMSLIFLIVFALVAPRPSRGAVNPQVVENPVPRPIQWWAL